MLVSTDSPFSTWRCVVAAVLVVGLCSVPSFADSIKPNVIVILADDLGYGELSVQGAKDIPTPNIDSLAAHGVRCTNGYVTNPVCAPTRAALLTGRYQQRFGFEFNPGPEQTASPQFGIPRDEKTIAQRLKEAGYATGLVGKWHVGFQPELTPTQRGFDEFFGFLGGAHPYHLGGRRDGQILRGVEPVDEKEYLTDAFAREAVGFIDKHKGESFFLYLAFNAVHAPLEATPDDLSTFDSIKDPRRRKFAAMLHAMDRAVGKVLEKLRAEQLEEKTLIFFLSDNGGPTEQTSSKNGALNGRKGQVLEGGVRVPFFVQWRGKLKEGQVYKHPVSSLDIAATTLTAARINPPTDKPLDGVDLMPFLSGMTADPPHERLCWRAGNQWAIREGDWKLVHLDGQSAQLFNLARDIGESKDLSMENKDIASRLDGEFQKWSSAMVEPKWKRGDRGRGNRDRHRLGPRLRPLDKNGDNQVTIDDFEDKDRFRKMDADGNGKITPTEVR